MIFLIDGEQPEENVTQDVSGSPVQPSSPNDLRVGLSDSSKKDEGGWPCQAFQKSRIIRVFIRI